MKVLIKALIAFCFLNESALAQKYSEESIHKTLIYLVFLDDGNKITDESEFNSSVKNYLITKIHSNNLNNRPFDFYKISINDTCNCHYYVAYELTPPNRIYKLKGFVCSDFMNFFNSALMDNAELKKIGKNKDSYNARKKYILSKITIDEINLTELYNYYSNCKRQKFHSKDIYSCFERTIVTAY